MYVMSLLPLWVESAWSWYLQQGLITVLVCVHIMILLSGGSSCSLLFWSFFPPSQNSQMKLISTNCAGGCLYDIWSWSIKFGHHTFLNSVRSSGNPTVCLIRHERWWCATGYWHISVSPWTTYETHKTEEGSFIMGTVEYSFVETVSLNVSYQFSRTSIAPGQGNGTKD